MIKENEMRDFEEFIRSINDAVQGDNDEDLQ